MGGNMLKSKICILIALIIFCLSACRNKNPGDTSFDLAADSTADSTDNFIENSTENTSPVIPSLPALPPLSDVAADFVTAADMSERLEIKWAYNAADFPSYDTSTAGNIRSGAVFDYLNSKFNIKISGNVYRPSYTGIPDLPPAQTPFASAAPKAAPKPDPVYDIFLANPYNASRAGIARTIPREMIERYAPDYANVLSLHSGWELNKADNGEYLGLSTFNADYDRLDRFSLYRLDWLEAAGFFPNGELVELGEGVMFTPEPFGQADFTAIMQAFRKKDVENKGIPFAEFVHMDLNETWGMYIPHEFSSRFFVPLMGMFDINSAVVEEAEKATPFFASTKFKSALRYVYTLLESDFVQLFGKGDYYTESMQSSLFTKTGSTVGWTSVSLPFVRYTCELLRLVTPDAKVLVTPPERGPGGESGVSVFKPSSAFTPESSWVIGVQVSDEKLIRILQIFNALAFDPETYVINAYGIEGEDFIWTGEPYASAMARESFNWARTGNRPTGQGVFLTNVISDVALEQEEYNGYPYLYEYARRPESRAMLGKPYREEVWGGRMEEKALLDHFYKTQIDDYIRDNLWRLISPEKSPDFDAAWEEYINALNGLGVSQYIEFYNKP
jgi:hypothetical protein